MCDHQLWPDVASVVCQRTDAHRPGASCRYVTDPAADLAVEEATADLPWSTWAGLAS